MSRLILYTTPGCHLCEQAEHLLRELARDPEVEVESVDIAADARLVERYGIRIPVVRHRTSGVELGWPFRLEDLQRLL